MESKLFSPVTFGPLTLRNRTIRSAAFESMCPENTPTQMLLDYHRSVAAGGVGMTTVAYAAVTQSGLSFDRQLWLRPSIIPRLHELTKAVHDEGAAVGIQIGHCGNMSHKNIASLLCFVHQNFEFSDVLQRQVDTQVILSMQFLLQKQLLSSIFAYA